MGIGKSEQHQVGGDNSTNVQASRDVHMHGLSYSEAREVALDVYKANAVALAGIAQQAAQARAEQITTEFLEKLAGSQLVDATCLQDPDVQYVLFQAQREYARSGEDDLREALVDLLATRAEQAERDLRTLALNEAIESAPKLTEGQRRAVAWIFYLRYTRDVSSVNKEMFYANICNVANALGVELPTRHADFQHMEYVGVGTLSFSTISFGAGVRSGSEGLFTKGIEEGEIEEGLRQKLYSAKLLTPCLRDQSRLQIDQLAEEDLPEVADEAGLAEHVEEIKRLFARERMSDEEVADEAAGMDPKIKALREAWEGSAGIRSMTLTSVGLALGHAYWSRLTGFKSPLSNWI